LPYASRKLQIVKTDVNILFISGSTNNNISNKEILNGKINYLQNPFQAKI
jgi:hypothetical protein